ncbi:potassium voltage-gated channel protein shaw [Plakobranchus ocellatus]|uniref:Potassium voltage-gated channel protein shaw n=1 Tax=Plakobranchus ocellatus TaxID=259542 RepID=A0AAV4C0W6_9GAST|nr:potassium voltage-gated channel protein shaw [Plakobranchus ocellatus]
MDSEDQRRPSFPQGGFDTHKNRHGRQSRAERRRTIPECQLPESDEDEFDSDGCESEADEDDGERDRDSPNGERGEEEGGGRRGEGKVDYRYYNRGTKKPKGGPLHLRGCPLFSTNQRHQYPLPLSNRDAAESIGHRNGRAHEPMVGASEITSSSSPNLLQPPSRLPDFKSHQSVNLRCRCEFLRNKSSHTSAEKINNNEKAHGYENREINSAKITSKNNDKRGNGVLMDDACFISEDGKSEKRRDESEENDSKTQRDMVFEKGADGGNGQSIDSTYLKEETHKDKRSSEHLNHNDGLKKVRKKRRSRETVILNVGGQTFETYRSTLRRLRTPIFDSDAVLQRYFRRSHGDYFFDRDATAFGSVLNFLRTGELHIPTNMCGPALQNELEFWGIEEVDIARCCWTQYNTWKTQCRSLEKLEYDRKFSTTQQANAVDSEATAWTKFRARVWTMLQDPGSSKKAKVYAWVSIIFVFISIFSFCAETHPLFKVKARDVTHLASFYDFFNVEPIQFGDQNTQPNINSSVDNQGMTNLSGVFNNSRQNGSFVTAENTSIKFVSTTKKPGLPSESSDHRNDRNSENVDHDNCDEDDDGFLSMRRGGSGIGGGMRQSICNRKRKGSEKEKDWGDRELPHPALLIMDVCCLAFFTLEYLTRFTCSPNKMDFLRALQNIVDFLAFAPDYVEIMFLIIGPGQGKEGVAVMEMLFILRILRLFRIFRLIRHVPGLWILLYTLKASFNELMLMCVFLLIGMVVFATLIHFAEPEGIFTNIPVGFWWAVVTMTTVGYGDMYPQSPAGYFIGSCCAVAGLLMIAFTVPIIVSNFVLYYTHVQYGLARRDRELEKYLEDEMEDEMEMLDASHSHLDVSVYEKGDLSGGGKRRRGNRGGGDMGSTKSLIPTTPSKDAHLDSPKQGKRQSRANSNPYSLMSAFVASPLQKKVPSSSRDSISSSKTSASTFVLPFSPPHLPRKCAVSESVPDTGTAFSHTPPSHRFVRDSNLTNTPAKSALFMTTFKNGKCYMGVTSKSDTDLSPSHIALPPPTTSSKSNKTSPLLALWDKQPKDSEFRQLKKGQRGNKVKDTNEGGLELGRRDKNKDTRDGRRGSCTIVLLDDDHVV